METLQLLQTTPVAFIALCGLLGLIVGSFLNVVIHRLPRMMEAEWREQCASLDTDPTQATAAPTGPRYNLIVPRSACPACGHQIRALENIPVLSYL
ncbi:MAG: prepilin peptidase, partial [Sulfurimicrobium sp.]|nr:prepilin peptidase [Sulfurimicrobium sp.]